jgi:hypothetical protein
MELSVNPVRSLAHSKWHRARRALATVATRELAFLRAENRILREMLGAVNAGPVPNDTHAVVFRTIRNFDIEPTSGALVASYTEMWWSPPEGTVCGLCRGEFTMAHGHGTRFVCGHTFHKRCGWDYVRQSSLPLLCPQCPTVLYDHPLGNAIRYEDVS